MANAGTEYYYATTRNELLGYLDKHCYQSVRIEAVNGVGAHMAVKFKHLLSKMATSEAVGTFATAFARLNLFHLLGAAAEIDQLLYCDTDSVFLVVGPRQSY